MGKYKIGDRFRVPDGNPGSLRFPDLTRVILGHQTSRYYKIGFLEEPENLSPANWVTVGDEYIDYCWLQVDDLRSKVARRLDVLGVTHRLHDAKI